MRIAVFLVALAVRIVAIEGTGARRITFGDGPDYLTTASSLCSEHVYPERGNLPFFRAPGFPFFIAAVTACHPHKVRAVKYGLALCDSFTAVIIASIAQCLFRRRSAAAIAGTLAAVDPLFIAAVCDVRSEPLFMLLLTLAIACMFRERFASAGVASAVAALTRPVALLAIPLFALARKEGAIRLLAAAALTLAPWATRNAVRYHELILVNDAAGFNFWRGSHPEMIRIASIDDRAEYRRAAWTFETQTIASAARSIAARAYAPRSRNRMWFQLGLDNIRAQPVAEFRWLLQKAWLYWRPWLNPQEYGHRIVLASAAWICALYAAASIGLARYANRRVLIAVLLFFVAMWIAQLPFQVVMRFRIPVTDPLLIVFAAGVRLRRCPAVTT